MNPLKEIVSDVLRFVGDRELQVDFRDSGSSPHGMECHLKMRLEKKKESELKKPDPPPNRDTTEGRVPKETFPPDRW